MATMKTLNGYGFDSAKLGGRAPEYYTNPRNLLYNSDFTNPVNQRGQTTYNAGGYTIDGWSIWSVNGDASLTLVEGGIAFNPGSGSGTFTQKLPLGLLDSAKTYTLAVHKSNGETQVKTDGVTFNHNGNGDLITISTVQETIVWAALYEGFYTADNVPPPFFYPQRLEMLNLGLPTQPRNLFDNSDFRKPVNQRGNTEITGDWNYGIDRWLVSTKYEQNPNGSILITDNGLSMGYWTDMMQLIPFEQIKGKTLTFAVCTENGVYAYTMTLPESAPPAGSGALIIGDGIWKDIIVMETIKYDNNDSVLFRFRNARTTNQLVYWAALYEGSYTAETLPPYVPKGYAVELAECQRYFWLCDNSYFSEGCGYAFAPNECRFMISTPQTMRLSPSIIADNNNTTSYGIKLIINGTVLTPTSVSVRRVNNRLCLTLNGKFTTNTVGVMRIESRLSFSADL